MNQRQLIEERDKLLKDSGFEDVETADGGILRVSSALHHVHRKRDLDHTNFGDIEEYYRRASHFLWERAWYDDTERRVWELHADGASYTRIVRTVKREGGRVYRRKVHTLVNTLRAEMLRDELAVRRGRGRPRSQDGLRTHGIQLVVRMSPSAALALDHAVSVLQVSQAEVVRRALVMMARQMTR